MSDVHSAVAPAPITLDSGVQVDIIRPGRRAKWALPNSGAKEGKGPVVTPDQGCCLTYSGVAFNTTAQGFALNNWFPYETRGIWNSEVTPVVMSAEGVLVNLSEKAQQQIRDAY